MKKEKIDPRFYDDLDKLNANFVFKGEGLTIVRQVTGDEKEIIRRYEMFMRFLKTLGIEYPILMRVIESKKGNTYIFGDFSCLYPWRLPAQNVILE